GLGRLIVGAKRLLWRLARPYTRLVLQRQEEFDTKLLHLMNAFVLPVRDQLRDGFAGFARPTEELSLSMHERLTLAQTPGLAGPRGAGPSGGGRAGRVHGLGGAPPRGPPRRRRRRRAAAAGDPAVREGQPPRRRLRQVRGPPPRQPRGHSPAPAGVPGPPSRR